MTSIYDIVNRWVGEVRKDDPKYLRPSNSNIQVHDARAGKRARLYSFGTHFELARWVDPTDDHDGFWLLNGDRYSNTTTGHQALVRSAAQRTSAPVLILPHSSLHSAGIYLDSITPVEITQDRYISEPVTVPLADLPQWTDGEPVDNGDGTWTYIRKTHVLGESLFSAVYQVYGDERQFRDVRALFLSAFDHQELNRHYFLCQLPDGATPTTVEQAFEALKPPAVVEAEAAGLHVTRQGDLFAVPTDLTTREVRSFGLAVKRERVLGISHAPTESVTVSVSGGGEVFARGILYHRPFESWRKPEHRRQKMGDGKTWHLLVKNTVPVDGRGQNRAWSQVGSID